MSQTQESPNEQETLARTTHQQAWLPTMDVEEAVVEGEAGAVVEGEEEVVVAEEAEAEAEGKCLQA